MVKLIYSSAFDATVDVGMQIVEDPKTLTKKAGTIFGCDYSALAPDKDHVGIHLVALGSYERYGHNRNGDAFEKAACLKYHPTFVKCGTVFRHHRNKDRTKGLGNIKASAYNDEMDRIELFIHAHKEKCADELTRMEKEGEIPYSMACTVPGDWCSICNTFRKNAEDPNECEHIKYELGKMRPDGKVACMLNRDPTFFDISFVGRPADRIAWNLKVASGMMESSEKLAADAGIWIPDAVAIASASALRKYAYIKGIADMQDNFRSWSRRGVKTASDRYFYELRKAASPRLDDATIAQLRQLEPADAFQALAKSGTVLGVRDFFKYAMGPELHQVERYLEGVESLVPYLIDTAVKAGDCQKLCNDGTFDVPDQALSRTGNGIMAKVAEAAIVGQSAYNRIIENTYENKSVKIAVDNNANLWCNTHETVVLAEKYAAYQLSAVDAIVGFHADTDCDTVLATLAAQNLIQRNQ